MYFSTANCRFAVSVVWNGSVYWYFSTANWTLSYDRNESVVPIASEFVGNYALYNKSDEEWTLIADSSYEISYETVSYVEGTPDESEFALPTYWRRDCAIDETYCAALKADESEEVCDEGLDLPTLPEHKYFAVLEGKDLLNDTTFMVKMWYNFDANELRNEYFVGDGSW